MDTPKKVKPHFSEMDFGVVTTNLLDYLRPAPVFAKQFDSLFGEGFYGLRHNRTAQKNTRVKQFVKFAAIPPKEKGGALFPRISRRPPFRMVDSFPHSLLILQNGSVPLRTDCDTQNVASL